MKTPIFALSFICSLLVGAPTHAAGLPASAKMLFQISGSASNWDAKSSEETFIAAAIENAEKNVQARINGEPTQAGMFTDSAKDPINVEYQCSSVYRVWGQPSASSRTFSRGGIFDGFGISVSAGVTVSVYCVPRDFRQKVVISAMQACEKEPKAECMSKEYLDAFSKMRPTIYQDINKP